MDKLENMSSLKPETIAKLENLQSKYPGAVDLIKLKEYLKSAQPDRSVEKYIEQVYHKIKVRSHLVGLVKNFLEKTNTSSVDFNQLQSAYGISDPPPPFLNREQLHSILMELSSPLTGYLGYEEGNDMYSDRFYFLRDLPIE